MSNSKYSVGSKIYRGTSSSPNLGPVTNKEGYAQRDLEYDTKKKNSKLKRKLLLQRIRAQQQGRHLSAENLKAPEGRTLNG